MYRIGICDDAPADRELIGTLVLEWMRQAGICGKPVFYSSAENFLFQGGSIVQYGSHEALLRDADGKYSELWNAQAQYYVE